MKKEIKKIKKRNNSNHKKEDNKILIEKKTLEVRSTQPPLDTDAALIHEDTKSENIVVVDTFKSADKLGECDKLEFELGRLRSYLVSWVDYLQIDNSVYKVMVDPMAKKIKVLDK